MIRVLFLKEVQNQIYSLRFQVSFAIILLVFIIGTVGFVQSHRKSLDQYHEFHQKQVENMKRKAGESATALAIQRDMFKLSPRNNGIISDCHEQTLPNKIVYSAYNVMDIHVSAGSVNPLLNSERELNWSFIVTMLISFLALLFSFDAISGEKEEKTLSLMLANSVSRGAILFGKFLSVVVLLLGVTLLGMMVSLLILIPFKVVHFDVSFLMECVGFLMLTALLISCFTAFGLFASVISTNSNVSMLLSLCFWLLFIVVIPNTAIFWANKLFPIDSGHTVEQRIWEGRAELCRNAPDGSWSSRGDDPFYYRHELRANLQRKIMENAKSHKDAFCRDMMNQFESTRSFTLLSPVALYDYSVEAYLGGGYLRLKKNWDDLHIYQGQFLQWFKDFDSKDEKSPHWYNPFERYSTTKLPVEFSSVPVYEERLPDFGQRFGFMGFYLAILILYTGGIFLLSFLFFIRYDVR